jgi:hypothetical protein
MQLPREASALQRHQCLSREFKQRAAGTKNVDVISAAGTRKGQNKETWGGLGSGDQATNLLEDSVAAVIGWQDPWWRTTTFPKTRHGDFYWQHSTWQDCRMKRLPKDGLGRRRLQSCVCGGQTMDRR